MEYICKWINRNTYYERVNQESFGLVVKVCFVITRRGRNNEHFMKPEAVLEPGRCKDLIQLGIADQLNTLCPTGIL